MLNYTTKLYYLHCNQRSQLFGYDWETKEDYKKMSLEEIRKQLIDYHSVDNELDDDTNLLDLLYFDWSITTDFEWDCEIDYNAI